MSAVTDTYNRFKHMDKVIADPEFGKEENGNELGWRRLVIDLWTAIKQDATTPHDYVEENAPKRKIKVVYHCGACNSVEMTHVWLCHNCGAINSPPDEQPT